MYSACYSRFFVKKLRRRELEEEDGLLGGGRKVKGLVGEKSSERERESEESVGVGVGKRKKKQYTFFVLSFDTCK